MQPIGSGTGKQACPLLHPSAGAGGTEIRVTGDKVPESKTSLLPAAATHATSTAAVVLFSAQLLPLL